MRTITLLIFILIFISPVMVCCEQSPKRIRKPVTSIQIAQKNKKHIVGEKITVNLQTKIKDGSLNRTELFLDGKSIFTSKKVECSFDIETSNLPVGTHILKSISTTDNDITGENYSDFLLLSDITPQKFGYVVNKSYPHSNAWFTEGLEIQNGFLYEGTGQEGSSALYKTDLSTWKIIKEYKLENQYFGEGITILNGKLYQLTYKTQIGFVRNPDTFELIKTWPYKNEQGWGLTNDGKSLIMSDGTEFITFIDPESLKEIKKIQVCNQKGVLKNINELEYINGEIWANVWTTDMIIKIDPKTGKIVAEIDLKGLLPSGLINQKIPIDVLNGIAYDHEKNKIYVTGKYWPKIFEIELIKQSN